ncbi:MAG: hypothetical protein ABIX01_24225 [Chitinophagaceae bacterium]
MNIIIKMLQNHVVELRGLLNIPKRGCHCIVLAMLCYGSATAQPNISRVEYFIDVDPGYGNGITIPNASISEVAASFVVDIALLKQGIHFIGIRSRDANGAWSTDSRWTFTKAYTSLNLPPQTSITRVEYFLDTDPGYGKGIPVIGGPGQDLAALSFNIDLVPLSQGVHMVGVRSQDANGAWSIDNKWLFLKPYVLNGIQVQPAVTRCEYYIDADPGYGNGIALNMQPGQDLSGLSFSLDLATLNSGVHTVSVRSRDANGAWSLDNKWLFLKPYSAVANNPVPNIVKTEYYIDADPGYGYANAVTLTPGVDIGMLVFDADISLIPNGNHKLGIRSMDALGAWSIDNKFYFLGGKGTSWVGGTSIDWNDGSNWSKGLVPTVNEDITVSAGTPFSPVIPAGITVQCKSLKVFPGASVTISTGSNLKVGQ